MKQKVINVKYRKSSDKFPNWMKYEVELMGEDGTTELIPAYGKDLQDALSRVVHDRKAEKVVSKLQRIPSVVYIALWFAYIYGLVHFTTKMNNPLLLLGVLVSTGLFVWSFNKYFSTRNTDKSNKK
jgi:hypothetical protein